MLEEQWPNTKIKSQAECVLNGIVTLGGKGTLL
jgi:hypothetical protein